MQDNCSTNFCYATISEIHSAYNDKKLSVRNLVLSFLSRIASIDKCKDGLNSVLEINPDALCIADELDQRLLHGGEIANRKSGDFRFGPLFGIPVLLKDNINTADRLHTSAGSVALADNYAPYDAHIVRRLREAGAIILGKANMTEFANYMTDGAMPNGYSSRGGQTLNFFDPNADPGGSSTGSAVAVIAGLCAAAVGTETFGSIISPSQAAGIVGIKPTAGLLSNKGIIPISFTLDTAGPMVRCAQDAGLLLGVLAGRQYELSPASGLCGMRIGISRMFTEETSPEWLTANKRLIGVMGELGADLVELPEHKIRIGKLCYHITKHEFKFGINSYLQSMGNPNIPQNLGAIIAYNEQHADVALKYGQDILTDVNDTTSGTMAEQIYTDTLAAREAMIHDFDKLFDDNHVDAVFMLAANSGLGAFTGFPCMTIPAGKTSSGLPIGSYFAARRFGEDILLRIASAVEQALR